MRCAGCLAKRHQPFKAQGAETIEVSLPQTALSIPAYYVLASAEASTNLSRCDGVRYGHRAAQFGDLEEMYSNTRAEGFGSEVKRRIMIGLMCCRTATTTPIT